MEGDWTGLGGNLTDLEEAEVMLADGGWLGLAEPLSSALSTTDKDPGKVTRPTASGAFGTRRSGREPRSGRAQVLLKDTSEGIRERGEVAFAGGQWGRHLHGPEDYSPPCFCRSSFTNGRGVRSRWAGRWTAD